jgi:tripartite-type tricarboxylate transporter receptor subunit TctC
MSVLSSKFCKAARQVMIMTLLASSGLITAQTHPNKPITMLIPFNAGGNTDQLAKLLQLNILHTQN